MGPKYVRSGNGRPVIALRCLMLMLLITPLRIVNHCCSGFPVRGGPRYVNVGNLSPSKFYLIITSNAVLTTHFELNIY